MNSQQIKEILLSEIHEVSINYEKYCNNPKRDFSRKRKLPFELMLKTSQEWEANALQMNCLTSFFFHVPLLLLAIYI